MAMDLALPTLYEYYTAGGVTSGLSADQSYFTLNGKNISIYSGATHYFRIPKQYWRDRIRKAKAAGLNTIETYVPWNLHEPQSGQYDFGHGGSDFEDFLDVKEFLSIVQEEDMFAILRPGPYICSEWEFGGFPSWLLREKNIKLRTSETTYMKYVAKYFNILLPILSLLQFTKGGPIIAFQVENEYGSTEQKGKFVPDREYLRQLRDLMTNNGIVELLVTSDSPTAHGDRGTLPGEFLQTANFQSDPEREFEALKKYQHNKPAMAMEFWSGWFDHWSENHHTLGAATFYNVYERILEYNASVNLYMFHGGTSFGFMNGANLHNGGVVNSGYQPDTTSYDYDAPLSENGDYTEKYAMLKDLLAKYNLVKTRIPEMPQAPAVTTYESLPIRQQISISGLTDKLQKFPSTNLISMEHLPINNGSGQSYGYIIYRKENLTIDENATLLISGHVCDTVVVLVNGLLVSKPLTRSTDLDGFGYWRKENSTITLSLKKVVNATLDLIVENWGRVGFGHLEQYNQFKGLWQGDVYVANQQIVDWQIMPLEFKRSWTTSLDNWQDFSSSTMGPALYKTTLDVEVPADTFLNMEKWTKGIVIVNGFVLGRFSKIGPQQTLYLPGPLMKQGTNEIVIFEHFTPASELTFSNKRIYKTIH